MRHRYTRQELESITRETPVYLEGAGIAQLQWGGLEIAEGVRDGYLYCKHIKPFALELYDKYWTAYEMEPDTIRCGKCRNFMEWDENKHYCSRLYGLKGTVTETDFCSRFRGEEDT